MDTYSPKGNICGAIIPDFILERDLSHGAMLLYSILCNYARDKDHCWPSQPKLAQVLKCSLSSVKTYLAELVREKLILIHHSFCRSNIYYLLRPAELEKDKCLIGQILPVLSQNLTPPSQNLAT